ncbi:hypothetical protein VTN49DRAFT_6247 [Thermomyces lanuginosus]|uniref:uncharacterized protein n=1 Tax=Thermomyces lanuginosus TaxID=5541 RepID=UPI003743C35D
MAFVERLLSGICYSHLSGIIAFSHHQDNGSPSKTLPFVVPVPYVSDLISHFDRCLFFFVVCALACLLCSILPVGSACCKKFSYEASVFHETDVVLEVVPCFL